MNSREYHALNNLRQVSVHNSFVVFYFVFVLLLSSDVSRKRVFFELNRDMMKLTYKNHSAANGFSLAAE